MTIFIHLFFICFCILSHSATFSLFWNVQIHFISGKLRMELKILNYKALKTYSLTSYSGNLSTSLAETASLIFMLVFYCL